MDTVLTRQVKHASSGLKSRTLCGFVVVFGVVCGSNIAVAGDWKFTPRATISETYSDNVRLAGDGRAESDFALSANAGASLHGTGRRLEVNADYNFQKVIHSADSVSDRQFHQWQVGGTAEVVEQIGFLEFRTTMSQENLSNRGRVSDSNLNGGGGRDVLTLALSPVIRHRFGSFADTEFRANYDRVNNDDGTTDATSTSVGTIGTISSGRRFQQLPWSASLSRRRVKNTNGSESRFASLDGNVSYVISRRWSANFGAGYDKNEFASRNDTKGFRWRTGLTWTPTERTRVAGGFERRFFDDTFFFDMSHRSRRTRWTANYRETVTTTRQLQLQRVIVPLEDEFGDVVEDPVTGEPILVPVEFAVPTDEVIVNRAFRGTVRATLKRSNATLTVFRNARTFQITNDEETSLGASVRLSHNMSARLRAAAGMSWTLTEPRASIGDETRWTWDASMSYDVGPSASSRLAYRYTTLEDDSGASDFEENRLTASLNLRF